MGRGQRVEGEFQETCIAAEVCHDPLRSDFLFRCVAAPIGSKHGQVPLQSIDHKTTNWKLRLTLVKLISEQSVHLCLESKIGICMSQEY